jgi:hypothetical protein
MRGWEEILGDGLIRALLMVSRGPLYDILIGQLNEMTKKLQLMEDRYRTVLQGTCFSSFWAPSFRHFVCFGFAVNESVMPVVSACNTKSAYSTAGLTFWLALREIWLIPRPKSMPK